MGTLTRYWLVHYVNREDPGDLLWGFNWREAVLVQECTDCQLCYHPAATLEAAMFDKETGKNVGNTRNFCIDQYCPHEDCGPAKVIAEVLTEPQTLENNGQFDDLEVELTQAQALELTEDYKKLTGEHEYFDRVKELIENFWYT